MNSRKCPGCFTLFCFCNAGSEPARDTGGALTTSRSFGTFLALWSSFHRRQMQDGEQVRHLYVVLSEAAGAEQRDACRERNSTAFGKEDSHLLDLLSTFTYSSFHLLHR